MAVAPIDSLDDLWSFNPTEPHASRPLRNYKEDKLAAGERELMICHDMKGGYLEEESPAGAPISSQCQPYTFLNWWNIDIFCYFSHHLVTVPPSGYTDVAHDHGCLVMGTFITEWHQGKAICDRILSSPESVRLTVEKLVQIAVHYGFEGWLINIENEIQKDQIPNLLLFISLLTSEMRAKVSHSRVIWYDSVTEKGTLRWQNQLNRMNKCFYDACDGIYLNYNWTDQMLLDSADFGQINRIFVGIDVFARGCVGEWQCAKSLACAKLLRMSVALFAPGWVAETYPDKDQIEYGLKFWNKLSGLTPCRPVTELPFNTDFCPGIDSKKQWFCLKKMSLQPCYSDPALARPMPGGGLVLTTQHTYRLLNCDLTPKDFVLDIRSSGPITVLVNGKVASSETRSDANSLLYRVRYSCDRILTIDIVPLQKDTVLHSINIYE